MRQLLTGFWIIPFFAFYNRTIPCIFTFPLFIARTPNTFAFSEKEDLRTSARKSNPGTPRESYGAREHDGDQKQQNQQNDETETRFRFQFQTQPQHKWLSANQEFHAFIEWIACNHLVVHLLVHHPILFGGRIRDRWSNWWTCLHRRGSEMHSELRYYRWNVHGQHLDGVQSEE